MAASLFIRSRSIIPSWPKVIPLERVDGFEKGRNARLFTIRGVSALSCDRIPNSIIGSVNFATTSQRHKVVLSEILSIDLPLVILWFCMASWEWLISRTFDFFDPFFLPISPVVFSVPSSKTTNNNHKVTNPTYPSFC